MENIQKLSDEKIISIVRKSDKELYSEIIKRYEASLMRYAFYLVNDQDEASDIVQNSFIKAYINLNGFDTNKKFSSWLFRIVHNEAINLIQKDKRVVSIDNTIDFESGVNLEDDLIKKELSSHAQNCLNQMQSMYSEPLALYYIENKSYEEISDILRIPMGTVATRIKRAKAIMKKICKK